MNGLELVRGLIDRGYSPHQAAALAGHMLQESGGNPSAVNAGEGANGLLQWRGDRWDNLQGYAKSVGKSPTDPDVQLDFIRREMSGPEARAGRAFLAAPDVDGASAALKGYIRYGDDSGATRLNNARGLYAQLSEAPVGALGRASGGAAVELPPGQVAAAPAPTAGGDVTASAPASASGGIAMPSQALANLAGGLGKLGEQMQQKPEFLEPAQIQYARPNIGQSQQIAAALAKAYGFGGV